MNRTEALSEKGGTRNTYESKGFGFGTHDASRPNTTASKVTAGDWRATQVGPRRRGAVQGERLRSHTEKASLNPFIASFNVRAAQRAMARGVIDTLHDEDLLRNKPRDGVLAEIERNLVDEA